CLAEDDIKSNCIRAASGCGAIAGGVQKRASERDRSARSARSGHQFWARVGDDRSAPNSALETDSRRRLRCLEFTILVATYAVGDGMDSNHLLRPDRLAVGAGVPPGSA